MDRITPEQVRHARASYVNALLIQSRGVLMEAHCTRCQAGRGPFPECHVQGHFGGCCGNCKWPDAAAQYHWPQDSKETIELSSDDDDDEDDVRPVRRAIKAPLAAAAPGSAAQPIVVS